MTWLETLFLITLLVVFPVFAYRGFPVAMRAIAEGVPGAREATYRETMVWQWSLALAGVVIWWLTGRTWEDLGIRFSGGWGLWVACGVALLVSVPLTMQLRATQASPEKRAEMRAQLGGGGVFLPRTPAERTVATALSVTAGICEELLYRGWLLGYFAPLIGMPVAVVLSLAVFGAGHAYGGRDLALKATALGAVFTALYLLSGSLWVPIVLHAFVDINMGMLSTAAFSAPDATEEAA